MGDNLIALWEVINFDIIFKYLKIGFKNYKFKSTICRIFNTYIYLF